MTDKLKKQIILNLPYLIFVYLFDKLCQGIPSWVTATAPCFWEARRNPP